MDLAQSTKVVPNQMVTPDFSKINLTAPQEFVKNQLAIQQSGQGIAANQGVSEAMQQSINPDTGEIDQNKLLSLLGRDPRTAYNLPEIANKVNLNAQSQELAKQARIKTQTDLLNWTHDRLGGLRLMDNLDHSHIVDVLAKGVEGKILTLQQAQDQLKDLPKDKQIGVMAQEVEKVIPEAVITMADGYKAVNYALI